MYKIEQLKDANEMPIDRYTLYCYIFDSYSHSYREIWNVRGLKEAELVQFLQKNSSKELETDFGFVVLKSGNGPAIFTTGGELQIAPVKIEVQIKESQNGLSKAKSLFSRKRRTNLSN